MAPRRYQDRDNGALWPVKHLALSSGYKLFWSIGRANVFTQTWSLGVEGQFYLLFPFFVWFSGLSQQLAARMGARNLALIIIPLLLFSVVGFVVFARSNPAASFYLVSSRFWGLAAGCLAYLCLSAWPSLRSSTNNPINS